MGERGGTHGGRRRAITRRRFVQTGAVAAFGAAAFRNAHWTDRIAVPRGPVTGSGNCETVRGAEAIVRRRAEATFTSVQRRIDVLEERMTDELLGQTYGWSDTKKVTARDIHQLTVAGYPYGTSLSAAYQHYAPKVGPPSSAQFLETLRDDFARLKRAQEGVDLDGVLYDTYENVGNAYASLWCVYLARIGGATGWNAVWTDHLRRLDYNLGQAFNRASDKLAQQYGYGGDEWAAGTNAVAKVHNEQRRVLWMPIARGYRVLKDELRTVRLQLASELARWVELAQSLSGRADDVHANGATSLRSTMHLQFEFDDSFSVMNAFMSNPGSADRLITGYGAYDFCQARPFPDIQVAEYAPTYDVFRMSPIVDDPIEQPRTRPHSDTDTTCRALAANAGQQP